ncbi:zinc finger protein, putative [Schistosoma mansoni]|uniref:zinc finger protein, putative n=1 Tax=Schistosoma mansoni TaxID=6183 RepID=UPI00022C8355|nr:zinc finger protein, putative [Schistosoma mansoni]|eukprot:XP_018647415.1 zinc finger protein, putative [Schistosoma mansoni]
MTGSTCATPSLVVEIRKLKKHDYLIVIKREYEAYNEGKKHDVGTAVSQGIPVWRFLLATVQNLREAANLVPKMSTPKLTYALKVTSSLQQKITDTVASRLPQEKSLEQPGDSNRQQVHLDSMLSQGGFQEATLITSDSDQVS